MHPCHPQIHHHPDHSASIEHNGHDLRDLSLIDRKRRLSKLIGNTKTRAIQYGSHLTGDGPAVFRHICRRLGGHRLEANRCAVSQRAVEDMGQGKEPGERGSAPGARGGVALDPPMSSDA
jgi:hypothetical protein